MDVFIDSDSNGVSRKCYSFPSDVRSAELLTKLHHSGILEVKLLTEELFVSAPASKPDVWHVETDVKSLRVYWKVSFIISKNGEGFSSFRTKELFLKGPLTGVQWP